VTVPWFPNARLAIHASRRKSIAVRDGQLPLLRMSHSSFHGRAPFAG
jgi:hypothetical protein